MLIRFHVINGLCPQDSFFNESYLIKRLSEEQLDTSFLLEYERRVSAEGDKGSMNMIYE